MNSLSAEDLKRYKRLIEDKETSASQVFSGLKNIFKGYFSNEQALIMIEPALKFLPLAEATDREIDNWRAQFEENSILLAENKEESDRLKAIVTNEFSRAEFDLHVEKLKRANERLIEIQARLIANEELGRLVLARSFENAKALEEIMIDASAKIGPEQDKYLWLFARKFWWVKFQARFLSTIFAFAIAVVLDYLCQSGEAVAISIPNIPSILTNHYVFLLVFFLVELFLVDNLKDRIARSLAIRFSAKSFEYISALVPDNIKNLERATEKYGISPITVMDRLVSLVKNV